MKWTIIILIMLSLIGSMMWMMPSQRQKYQAKLRMRAKTMGYQVQLARITGPRAEGEVEPDTVTVPAYRLMRTNMDRKESEALKAWQVFRVRSIASDGLPDGWSWSYGEGELSDSQLALLAEILPSMPADVVALESSPVQVSVYWQEGEEEDLEILGSLKEELDKILSARF